MSDRKLSGERLRQLRAWADTDDDLLFGWEWVQRDLITLLDHAAALEAKVTRLQRVITGMGSPDAPNPAWRDCPRCPRLWDAQSALASCIEDHKRLEGEAQANALAAQWYRALEAHAEFCPNRRAWGFDVAEQVADDFGAFADALAALSDAGDVEGEHI